ncbi:MAG TPA: SDR family oxidoreductase [Acetobacteraceae bacterium]|nr:SDR family oxidoreductase [Acetobacteraceae bacterium]
MIALDGRVAIVTGAAQGLGAAIAQALCAAGARVIVADIAQPAWDHANAVFQRTDLAEDADIDACVAATCDNAGRLDILVNCAVTYLDNGLASTRAEWHRALDVNLIGAMLLTARAAERMTRGGVVVNIGSVGGKFGAAGRMLYPAAKAALLQLTRTLAVTLAPRGIRVLSVSPAWTWSPALERMAGSEARADAVGAGVHPLGRVGRGEDVARVVLFACSDLAGFVTGTDIAVDGGFSALGPDAGRGPRAWFAEGG